METISALRFNLWGSVAVEFTSLIFPEVRVNIMVPSGKLFLQELRTGLAKPRAIKIEKTMVALVLFIRVFF